MDTPLPDPHPTWGDGDNGFFQQVVERLIDGIWVIDLQGRTLYANPRVASMCGRDVAELADLTLFDVHDSTGKAQLAEHLALVAAGIVNTEDVETLIVRKDGSTMWVLIREQLMQHPETGQTCVLLRLSDYSRRRQERQEIASATERLNLQLEQYNLLQGVASLANDARSLADVLARGRDLLLLIEDWQRAIGFLVEDGELIRVHPDEEDRARAAVEDAADPAHAALERQIASRCARTGAKEWDEDRTTLAFPIRHDGGVYAVAVITAGPGLVQYDLIEHYADVVTLQLEHVLARELAQRSIAEARDRAITVSRQKSEFLAMVSHEIRTPLNGVIGLNELLRRTTLDTNQTRLADGIRYSGELLMTLINDILDFSKIEAGRMRLETVGFDLKSVLEQVTAPLRENAVAKGLDFDISYGDSPGRLRGDPIRISQIYANLLANAVKFTSVGSVEVEVLTRELDGSVSVAVVITDTGIGISPDSGDIFAPFEQADSTTTRVFGGSGLGLAISRQLAQAMGGDVGYHSEAGEGSTFWFTAVIAPGDEDDPSQPPTTAETPAVSPRHVLVVEDNAVNQLVASGMLATLGHTSDVADNGLVALDMLDQGSYDLVLMDVQMPGLDGYAATKQIRAGESDSDRLPIVAMTANVVAGERERCLAAGMDDFLTKPVGREALARTLAKWLSDQPEADVGATLPAAVVPAAAPVPADDDCVLDTARLEELRTMDPDNSTYLTRVLDRFDAGAAEAIETLRAAQTPDDLRFGAHRLLGSASNIGVVRVAALARELEEVAESGTTQGSGPIIDSLATALDQGQAALRSYRERFI